MTEVHGELYDALLAANVPEDKARAAARLGLAEIRQEMATKQDLRLLKQDLRLLETRLEECIAQTEARLEARQEARIAQTEARQEARMARSETRLTWRMVGIAGLATAFLTGVITST